MLDLKGTKASRVMISVGMFSLAAAVVTQRFFHPPDAAAGFLFGVSIGATLVGVVMAKRPKSNFC